MLQYVGFDVVRPLPQAVHCPELLHLLELLYSSTQDNGACQAAPGSSSLKDKEMDASNNSDQFDKSLQPRGLPFILGISLAF